MRSSARSTRRPASRCVEPSRWPWPGQRLEYPNGDEIQCLSIAFVVRDWAGEPRADGVEGSEVRFWPIDALPDNLTAIHARTLEDLGQYRSGFLLSGQ
jgi:hypothetical protein